MLLRNKNLKMPDKDLNNPPTLSTSEKRLGFLEGQQRVPDNFDKMAEKEIAELFANKGENI